MPEPNAMLPRQLLAFHLAGTVAIPSPFPEVGKLSLLPRALQYRGCDDVKPQDMLAVEHAQSNRLTITRQVRLEDVAALLFAPVDAPEPCWCFGLEIPRQLLARSSKNQPTLLMGIAYVREQAPVLMRVEVGMTAAQSAEYYPPDVGERSDTHYQFKTIKVPYDCESRPPEMETVYDCESRPKPPAR